ncbi:hypothetical protein CON05_25525 [Bacillus cereus]|nr:hypothetical protein CON05_25525 [Bacillus cereus]
MRTSKEFCLYYNSDLHGEPIPKQSQKAYGATHFTRKIGITSNETDRILKDKAFSFVLKQKFFLEVCFYLLCTYTLRLHKNLTTLYL